MSERSLRTLERRRHFIVALAISAPLSLFAITTAFPSDRMAPNRKEMNRRLIRLSEDSSVGLWASPFYALPEQKRVFRAVWELEAQVNNGGFYQYFWNSSASSAPHVRDALRAIGAHAAATIAESAIATVGGTLPQLDTEARRTLLAALPTAAKQELEALDQAFFRYPDDLTTLLYQYVSNHRHEIGAPEDF